MTIYDKYFIITTLTILLTRILVFVFNKHSPTIKGFRTHHWMYGLLFTIILFSISSLYKNIYLLSISMGIFLDEIGFILIRGKTHEDNYSIKSFVILIFSYYYYMSLKNTLLIFT